MSFSRARAITTKPRVLSSSNNSSTSSSSAADWRFSEGNEAAPVLSGRSTEEEVRERQMTKYFADRVKFQEKEKEKADKKRNERHARYSHVTSGEKLGFGEQRESSVVPQASSSIKPQSDNAKAQLEQKDEEFRKQMKARRELMQKQYDNRQISRSGV